MIQCIFLNQINLAHNAILKMVTEMKPKSLQGIVSALLRKESIQTIRNLPLHQIPSHKIVIRNYVRIGVSVTSFHLKGHI